MQPDAVIQATMCGVLTACLDGRSRTCAHLLLGHVRVEECATVRRVRIDQTLALEEPMAVTVDLPSGNQRGKRLVRDGADMLLGPDEHILFRRTQTREVGNIQTARDMLARRGTV